MSLKGKCEGEGFSISNKEYRQRDGISASDLKKMAKSMAHYKYVKDNPNEGDTPSLLFGRAYHKFCLEPSDFFNEFAVSQKFDGRTKEGKEAKAKFIAENEGKDIIDEETYQKLCDMRDALYATPFAKKLIYGEHEKSFFWDEDGLTMKCRPDSYGKIGDRHIIVDLKTTKNAETDAFMRDSIKYGYDCQAAHYCTGMKAITGEDFTFIFIAQEVEAPYCVNILEADEYFMQSGYQTRKSLLEDYKKCLEKNEFPAYMGFADEVEINSLGVPKWIADTLSANDIESEE